MTDTDTKAKNETQNPLPEGLQPWEGSSSVVNQGTHWSSTLIWLSAAIFGSAVIVAFTTKVDQTITVPGKLEPTGSSREVDSPSAGVVARVLVRDGAMVKSGQPLLEVEANALNSRRQAVLTTIDILEAQNRALATILSSNGRLADMAPMPGVPAGMEPALAAKVATALQQTQQIRARLQQLDTRIASSRETLALNERIERDLRPLFEGGGMSRIQYLNQRNAVQEKRAEVASLIEDKSGVIGAAAGQITQNTRELESLRSELAQLRESIGFRTINAPVAGQIFDLKVRPQSVISTDQVVLKIVPPNRLQATVEISNRDIGFVHTGLPVSVGVDSFPAGEFGYIKGTLTAIGSDALPPGPDKPFYRFPAVVTLKQQDVESGGKRLNLQSGMSVSANIRLRSRPAINLVSDLFTKQLEGVKRFR